MKVHRGTCTIVSAAVTEHRVVFLVFYIRCISKYNIHCITKFIYRCINFKFRRSTKKKKEEMNKIICFIDISLYYYIVMNGRSSPVLFEFISVPICHGPSCPITGGRGFCPLQVRPQYVSVLFKFDTIHLYVSASG